MDHSTVHRRRWQILTVLCLSLVLIGLDNLILNLALPKIQTGLGSTSTELQWIIDSYTLAFGGLLLLCGTLADRFGRKRLLLVGLLLFMGFSVGAAFADDSTTLIVMRAAMGVGAAMIMPATLSIIKNVFPPEEQAKAIGIWAATAALGVPLGPVVSGLLLEHFWWGSVFLINVPVVIVALVAGLWLIPESRNEKHPGLDLLGVLLSVLGLVALVYGLVEASRNGWSDPVIIGSLGGGTLLLVSFVLWERRAPHPMLQPELFRDARFSGAAAAITALSFGMFGVLFVLTQYLQFVLSYEPLAAGLRLLPIATVIAAAPLSPKLVERIGLRWVVAAGLVLITGSLALTAGAGIESETRVLTSLALFGLGLGLGMPAAADAMLAAAPSGQAGAGSAVTDAAMQVGGALGIAVVGSVLTTSYRDALPRLDGLPGPAAEAVGDSIGAATAVAPSIGGDQGRALIESAREAFVEGFGDALLLGAAVTAVGVLVALVVLPGRQAREATAGSDGPREGQRGNAGPR
ncbi:EmrB/QacA subfamily drug resistance transporter [Kibdelosporangium banguiense]|uniref:EmrB/QacA subfamily drug resistance transporter n=1 Tax=Kibdelosporangium banguiense TaxID=1365924 RepID=A0ABS4TT24_9PSEU|nr:MFS transporter [Kibdelosporangium banguiense]MBP2327558.1 EmrB/QacA subfamily drug resistance transporter [Kibdelosporangium banguiense]